MDFAHLLTDTYALIVVGVAFVALVYVSLYYGLTFMRLGNVARKKGKPITISDEAFTANAEIKENECSTSLIMMVTNQSESLSKHMLKNLMQSTVNYEAVVVEYMSGEETRFILQTYQKEFGNLNVIRLKNDVNFFHGNKYPLSIGIRAAKGDVLLLTEPDSEAVHCTWVERMAAPFTDPRVDIVLGLTRLNAPRSMYGFLAQYHNMAYNSSLLTAAMSGHAYTGLIDNMAVRRDFFFKCGGFISHYVEPDGADDIFVNRNAGRDNVAVSLEPESAVVVDAPYNYASWRYMRRRRYSTRCYYSFAQRMHLVMRPVMVMLFYALCAAMYVMPSVPWLVPSVLLLLKVVWQMVCVGIGQRPFALRHYHWFAPFFELYFIVSNTILSIITLHPKRCNP